LDPQKLGIQLPEVIDLFFYPAKMKDVKKNKKGPSANGDQSDGNQIKKIKNHLKHRSNALIKIIKYFKNINNNSF
jgi:hypothetical protein